MFILCVGISHQTAPVALREPLAMDEPTTREALMDLTRRFQACETVILSTCNRTELYIARPLHGHPRRDELVAWLAERSGGTQETVERCVYHHESKRAVDHLFAVAAGLESMVLGEYQIAHQIKRAYELAQEAGTCGRALNRIFQSALAAGKQVRHTTQIGRGRLSIASVAVEFAERLFEDFTDKTVVSLGAGKMAALAVQHFMERRPGRLIVCNRTEAAGLALAERFSGEVLPLARWDQALAQADIVISFTGACEPIVTAELFRPIHRQRHHRPLFLFDLSMPRDIDPAIGRLADVYLYDLDALQEVVQANQSMRQDEVDAARAIVNELAETCYSQVQTGDLGILIKKLRGRLQEIGQAESNRIATKLATADPDRIPDLLTDHTHRLINKILHAPLTHLTRESGTEAAMLATALRRLFELEPAEHRQSPEHTCTPDAANAQVPPGHATDEQ